MKFIRVSNFPKDKVYVLLDKEYRELLFRKSIKKLNCKNYFELALFINKISKNKFNGGDIKYWIEGKRLDKRTGKIHNKLMPLWLVLRLIKLLDINLNNLDNNIVLYRSGSSGLIIDKPKLPIEITPELISIIFHMFGDGAAGNFTPSYTQKNKNQFDNFIKKLENCFGKFQKSIYFTQGKYQVKFPKVIIDILSDFYSIDSFKSHESKIPKLIFEEDKESKLAGIVSFIVDEGYVRDVVILYSANKKLLSAIKRLIEDCQYKCSKIKYNKKAGGYFFALSNKSIKNFYDDVEKLSKQFSTCNLSFKKNDIKFIVDLKQRKNPKNYKFTDELILTNLEGKKVSAKQISKLMNYAYCTVLHHLEKLYDEKKVKRKRMGDGTYIWKLYEFTGKKG